MARTKTNTSNSTENIEPQDLTDIQNKIFLVFLIFVLYIYIYMFYIYLNDFSKKCGVTTLLQSMTCKA